jgi:hypothetical protein
MASQAAVFVAVAVAKPMFSGVPKSWMTGRLMTEKNQSASRDQIMKKVNRIIIRYDVGSGKRVEGKDIFIIPVFPNVYL